MASNSTDTNYQQASSASNATGRAASTKYQVTVATTGPPADAIEANGNQPILPIVERAFEQLGITADPATFLYKSEAGDELTLQDKVKDACATTTCRIVAVPRKAEDA